MTPATVILMLILILPGIGIRGAPAFTPKDHYLLYCGPAYATSAAGDTFDGRVWSHDENSTFYSPSSFSSTVTASINPDRGGSLFKGARLFKSNFTYTFPVSSGPKFLRLFFYPAAYSPYDASRFFLSVEANGHLLLRNFSAQLAVNYAPFTVRLNTTSPDQYVIKEYYLSVDTADTSLNLTFSPTPPSPFAFVNGIELVSVPDTLYVAENKTLKNVEYPSNPFRIPSSSALETAYRLNVGGSQIGVDSDGEMCGMYRLWKNDDAYTFPPIYGTPAVSNHEIDYTREVPNYTAPERVYQMYKYFGDNYVDHNLTWRFKVDPGFYYMVRLHWCEVDFHINTTDDRIFEVYINNVTAENDANVMIWTNSQRYVPYYKDYVVFVGGGDGGGGGSEDLWIALHPNAQSVYLEVLLNGLEIFKINRNDSSLDGPNPDVPLENTPPQQPQIIEPQKGSHLLGIIGGIVAGVLLVALLAFLLILRRSKAKTRTSAYGTSTTKSNWSAPSFESGSLLPSHLCRQFSLAHIRQATNDFSDDLIVGHGGFGNVYKGTVDGEKGPVAVAIKRLNASSKQGHREFVTEIQMLSKLRHIHLVSLIGFCDEGGEMILVYEYMDRGTLRDHLYNTDNPPLSWNQRLNACLGAAKGLHYLHCGASQMIIHRDVKSTNILLNENWASKVSDFGLSKLGPMDQELVSHVSTAVKGSIGYLDLEFYKTQRLTDKSDVYSFGVVLFEVLCGRAAVNASLSKEQVNLAKWARSQQRAGILDAIVDPNIKDEIAPTCLRKFGELAESCVRDHGSDRPSMADVVWSLEFVLGIQEKPEIFPVTVTAGGITTGSPSNDTDFSSFSVEGMGRMNSLSSLTLTSSQDYGESNQSSSGVVFSEIFKPRGR